MRFSTVSVSFEHSGAFILTWKHPLPERLQQVPVIGWQPRSSVAGMDGVDAPDLLQHQVHCPSFCPPPMPHKLNTLTFYGVYGWRIWTLRELGGLGNVRDNISGGLSSFWREHWKRCNCSAAAGLASSLYHCSRIHLRNMSLKLVQMQCSTNPCCQWLHIKDLFTVNYMTYTM